MIHLSGHTPFLLTTLGTQAAPYWRSKADVDGLDGGLDRNNRRLNNDGLAMEVLKLAPNNQEVRGGVSLAKQSWHGFLNPALCCGRF